MFIRFLVPRPSEAEVSVKMKEDIVFTPRAYRAKGRTNALYLTAGSSTGEREYVIQQDATTGKLYLMEQKPVTPFCDQEPQPRKETE
jgi:hypothetical protein